MNYSLAINNMKVDGLNDKFCFGKFNGCTLGEVMTYNPDYIKWVAHNVEGQICYFTPKAIQEIDKMFPDFIYDESFLADIEKQREEHNTFQNNRRNCSFHHEYSEQEYYEEQTYDKYCGSYAQDEMGYSDDDIDTIFDGDPDAYWNID